MWPEQALLSTDVPAASPLPRPRPLCGFLGDVLRGRRAVLDRPPCDFTRSSRAKQQARPPPPILQGTRDPGLHRPPTGPEPHKVTARLGAQLYGDTMVTVEGRKGARGPREPEAGGGSTRQDSGCERHTHRSTGPSGPGEGPHRAPDAMARVPRLVPSCPPRRRCRAGPAGSSQPPGDPACRSLPGPGGARENHQAAWVTPWKVPAGDRGPGPPAHSRDTAFQRSRICQKRGDTKTVM